VAITKTIPINDLTYEIIRKYRKWSLPSGCFDMELIFIINYEDRSIYKMALWGSFISWEFQWFKAIQNSCWHSNKQNSSDNSSF
jgi:hypothetical protein